MMKRRCAMISATLALILIFTGFAVVKEETAPKKGLLADYAQKALLPCNYFDAPLASKHFAAEPLAFEGMMGAIVPHYAPALDMAAAALKTAAENGASRIVVVGPNHEGAGESIVISGKDWQSPFGLLQGDSPLAEAIIASPNIPAFENDTLLTRDHSVSTLIPYVAKFLPEARVTAILLAKGAEVSHLEALAGCLAAMEEPPFLLISCDFSHYQTPATARANDRITIDAITSFDIDKLLAMDGAHLDSPESVALGLIYCQKLELAPVLSSSQTYNYFENNIETAGSFMLFAFAPLVED